MSFNMKEEHKPEDAKVFGYSGSGTATSVNDEIMGEWILYSMTQTEDVRKGIEAYLMWKWLGKRLDGYSSFYNMKVAGDGVLAVSGPEYLPNELDEFTGSLEFTRTEWSFAIPPEGGTEAVDAVKYPGRDLTLPDEISVTVDVNGAVNGDYTLFKADSITGVEKIALGASSKIGGKTVSFVVSEGEIAVRVASRGTVFVIR